MKKTFVVLFSLAFVLSALCCTAATNVLTEGNLHYIVADEKVSIVDCFGTDSTIRVPSVIGGYPVTKIRARAFANNEYLEKVYLPESVVSIGENAFSGHVTVVCNYDTDYATVIYPYTLYKYEPEKVESSTSTVSTPSAESTVSAESTTSVESVTNVIAEDQATDDENVESDERQTISESKKNIAISVFAVAVTVFLGMILSIAKKSKSK